MNTFKDKINPLVGELYDFYDLCVELKPAKTPKTKIEAILEAVPLEKLQKHILDNVDTYLPWADEVENGEVHFKEGGFEGSFHLTRLREIVKHVNLTEGQKLKLDRDFFSKKKFDRSAFLQKRLLKLKQRYEKHLDALEDPEDFKKELLESHIDCTSKIFENLTFSLDAATTDYSLFRDFIEC